MWKQNKPQKSWVSEIATWTNSREERALELLNGISTTESEAKALSQATGYSQDELLFTDLLAASNLDIWQENVVSLVNSLARGENSQLAEALGIKSSTISNWKSRRQKPEKTHKQGIYVFFGVPSTLDIEEYPLFLSLSPISSEEQRLWLREKIDQLSNQTLQQLFPALERLLKEP
ncbi:MAG: hypothetical protein AAFV85_23315 [Cyanobacteria bacterium J06634_6]